MKKKNWMTFGKRNKMSKKVKIFVKKLNEAAKLPLRAHPSDAGADVFATSKRYIDLDNDIVSYGTGIALAIPDGYWVDLRARSSVYKTGQFLANGVGTIDSGYRGEIMAVFYANHIKVSSYNIGDKIAQLVVMPNVSPMDVEFVEVDELPDSERGEGGFGSTGNK